MSDLVSTIIEGYYYSPSLNEMVSSYKCSVDPMTRIQSGVFGNRIIGGKGYWFRQSGKDVDNMIPNIVTRTDLLNTIIKKYKYKSYLEIGLADMKNFKSINIGKKVGVDPAIIDKTFDAELHCVVSDEYFKKLNPEAKFDLIFIDGDHHAEQFLKDVENSLKHLSPGGLIICHDCNPVTYERQTDEFKSGAWNGTVWKGWATLRMTRSDLEMYVLDMDEGCGIIKPGKQNIYVHETNVKKEDVVKYEYLESHRKGLLNLKPVSFFFQDIAK